MNIILSDRLKNVAELVSEHKKVADIGCDHAYVSIYLANERKAEKVIAMDVAKGPLEGAAKNISAAHLNETIETRLSNGFEALKKGETDCAVIAGMGGMLIIDILKAGISLMEPGYELILSPQSDQPRVRRFLRESCIYINKEINLYDSGKYYNILKAVYNPSDARDATVSEEDTELYDTYGEYLLKNPDEVFVTELKSEERKLTEIIEHLDKQTGEGAVRRKDELLHKLELCKKALRLTGNI